MKQLDKLRKFAEGGKVRKYSTAGVLPEQEEEKRIYGIRYALSEEEESNYKEWQAASNNLDQFKDLYKLGRQSGNYGTNKDGTARTRSLMRDEMRRLRKEKWDASRKNGVGKARLNASAEAFENTMSSPEARYGMEVASKGLDVLDNGFMGDKNFGAQSQAIDGAVDMASEALLKSGNPYCAVAAVALKGANFLTKAGGQTVQGFDVDINSSGYGDLGHMESSSSRDFGAMIGLGGLNTKRMQDKLKKRNDQAQRAMIASEIANDQLFEQEARMNSIQNTIMNNQMALAGGLETSLLGG